MARLESVDVRYLYQNVMSERDNLRSFQANTRNKLGSVKGKLSKADGLAKSLVHENETLNHELGSLKYKFGETQKCIETFSKEKEEIHADLRELKTLLADTEETNSRDKEKMTQEKALMSMSLDRLRHEVGRVREERDDAERKMLLLEEVLQIKAQEGDQLKKEKLHLETEMVEREHELEQQVTSLKQDCGDVRKASEEAVQDNVFLKMELDKARIQMNSAENQNKTLAENKAKLKGEFNDVCTTFNQMKCEYEMYKAEVQNKIEGLETEISKKATELLQTQREKNRAEAVMDDMKKTINVAENEMDKTQKEIQVLKDEMKQAIAEKEAEVTKLIAFGKGKEKLLKQSDSLLTSKEKAMEQLKEELEDYKNELADTIREKNEMKEKLDRRDIMINEWTSKCSHYETERQQLEARYEKKMSDIMQELNSMKDDCRGYTTENKELQEINNRLSNEMASLKETLKNLSNNAANMKSDIKDMRENKRKFEVECQLLREHNRNLQVKNDEISKAKDTMVKKNEELKIEHGENVSRLENIKVDHTQMIMMKIDLEKKANKLLQDVKQSQNNLQDKEKHIEEIKRVKAKEVEQCKKEIKSYQEEAQFTKAQASKERLERETEIVGLKVEMKNKEQEVDSLATKCKDLEGELVNVKEVQEVAQVAQVEQANFLGPCDDIGLFRPLDGSTPLPTSEEVAKEIELGDEHKEIISKLQNRWGDVIEERKQTKKAMLNFYHLIDILIDGKDKLENELSTQKKTFEKKIKALKEENSSLLGEGEQIEVDDVMNEENTGDLEAPVTKDPHVVEANLNNILHETNLYEGHIQYLKQQIGLHYSKAEKALDKHKSTMRTVTRMPNGKSLVASKPGQSRKRSDSVSSTSSSNFGTIMAEHNGYKALADKHFQMINELSGLRKQVAGMKEDQSRLAMENSYLKSSNEVSELLASGTRPALLRSQANSTSKAPKSREDSKKPSSNSLATGMSDSKYRAAIQVLKRELSS